MCDPNYRPYTMLYNHGFLIFDCKNIRRLEDGKDWRECLRSEAPQTSRSRRQSRRFRGAQGAEINTLKGGVKGCIPHQPTMGLWEWEHHMLPQQCPRQRPSRGRTPLIADFTCFKATENQEPDRGGCYRLYAAQKRAEKLLLEVEEVQVTQCFIACDANGRLCSLETILTVIIHCEPKKTHQHVFVISSTKPSRFW